MKLHLPAGLGELTDILRPHWPAFSDQLNDEGALVCEGDPDPDPDPDPAKDPDPDPAKDPDKDPDPDPDPDPAKDPDKDKTADDYRKELRQYERNAKRASEKDKKRIADLEKNLKEREDADKSEQEKAVEAARQEGETAAETKYREQRRGDQLELAVTRQATKGVKLEVEEDGETVEKVVRFADPDDALVHLERAIKRGEVDGDDIFDTEGKVKKDALSAALVELLEEKPHLAAKDQGDNGVPPTPKGGSDAGKGKGGPDAEPSVGDLVKAKQVENK